MAGEERALAGLPIKLMPRPVRRVIRSLNSFSVSDFLCKSSTIKAMSAAVLLGVGGVLIQEDQIGGHVLASAASSAGLSVSKLVINGVSQLETHKIEEKLGAFVGRSMLAVDVDIARASVAEINWVKSVNVKKAYPDTLVIDLVERDPVALWKSGQTIYLISRNGLVIDRAKARHMHLPQVVGKGANQVAAEFLAGMERFPNLAARSDAYVRVAERRWNIILDDGPSIMLPAEGWRDALAQLEILNEKDQLLDRDIVHVDMRLPDRLVLKLPADEAEIRRTRIEKSIKRSWHKT